nr:hypothetical protein [Tanacetum cinerariifolium]
TQLCDFLKYNQKEVDELKAERIAKTQDPLALMANSNNPYFRQYAGNLAGYNDVIGNQKEEAGIQLQAEVYDLMAAVTDSALVYDTDGSAEVHENCDDNEIFNMFTQEDQYTELLKPIPESHQVPQNDNDVISEDTNVEQGRETVEQHPVNFEETRALYESLYQNLQIEVEKVNSVNRKLKETNADLTTELAGFKNQERQMQMIEGNGRNQFRQYAGNLNGYNAVQNVGNQVAQNPRVQNDKIQNQIGNGNLVVVRAEGNAAGHNGN